MQVGGQDLVFITRLTPQATAAVLERIMRVFMPRGVTEYVDDGFFFYRDGRARKKWDSGGADESGSMFQVIVGVTPQQMTLAMGTNVPRARYVSVLESFRHPGYAGLVFSLKER